MADPVVSRISWRETCRLVSSRYPSVGLFDAVAAADDLEAVIELEGWTNDRLSAELGALYVLPREEWVVGRPMASVVMAPFCHPHPGGARFSDARRGAWYAARHLETAIDECAYHRWQELQEVGVRDARVELRLYHADFRASFHDLRGDPAFEACLSPDSYAVSQELARDLLVRDSNGMVYPSVRRPGGECLVCFRPALVGHVRAAAHFELLWAGRPKPEVRRLRATS